MNGLHDTDPFAAIVVVNLFASDYERDKSGVWQ